MSAMPPTVDTLPLDSISTRADAAPAASAADQAPRDIIERWELPAAIAAGMLLGLYWAIRLAMGHEVAQVAAWGSLGLGLIFGGKAALDSIRQGAFDIDALMVIAAVLAAATGHPQDGALLLFLFVLSGALEARAMRRTRHAVESLSKLIPTAALVLDPDSPPDAPRWKPTSPESLGVGDIVLVGTGERVPADASVRAGQSSIDESTLTGESLPRHVAPGGAVYAGTINLDNPIQLTIAKPASESSVQRILRMVLSAQAEREPIQRVIDRLGQPYAIGVVLLSLLVFFVWWLGLGRPLWSTGEAGGSAALTTAITLLIVASPCALVIATPTATLSAISRAARNGVLFKGGQAIDRLARLAALCVDKTGTLTQGRPSVIAVQSLDPADEPWLLSAAVALEEGSTHPIAQAIRSAHHQRSLAPMHATTIDFVPAQGLRGRINDQPSALGTLALVGPSVSPAHHGTLSAWLDEARDAGHIAVAIAFGQRAGVITLADDLRPSAPEAIAELHRLGVRPIHMLTGDNERTARSIAARLDLDGWNAELHPEHKVEHLRGIVAEVRRVRGAHAGIGVMGDGVNDAPALALADVSIAIGTIGSAAAMESADIVLLRDDLRQVPWALVLARRTRRIIAFNLSLAMGIIVLMGLATLIVSWLGGEIPLPLAVIAHEGGTLLVVANSLRLTIGTQKS